MAWRMLLGWWMGAMYAMAAQVRQRGGNHEEAQRKQRGVVASAMTSGVGTDQRRVIAADCRVGGELDRGEVADGPLQVYAL